jgi:hypothetical protein
MQMTTTIIKSTSKRDIVCACVNINVREKKIENNINNNNRKKKDIKNTIIQKKKDARRQTNKRKKRDSLSVQVQIRK